MEILNYDIETHSFVKTSKNLGDMVTKVRELNWDYSEKDYEFDLRYMKIVDTLFKEKIKIQSKRNTKSNEDAELVKYLYSQIPKPKENTFKCNIVFYGDDLKSLRIDYFCLSSIVNIIMNILDNIINQNNFSKLLSEVIEENNFSRIMDIALWGKSIMKYKDEENLYLKLEIQQFDGYECVQLFGGDKIGKLLVQFKGDYRGEVSIQTLVHRRVYLLGSDMTNSIPNAISKLPPTKYQQYDWIYNDNWN